LDDIESIIGIIRNLGMETWQSKENILLGNEFSKNEVSIEALDWVKKLHLQIILKI
jgi:hypothetical protein